MKGSEDEGKTKCGEKTGRETEFCRKKRNRHYLFATQEKTIPRYILRQEGSKQRILGVL